ncbi:MAG TPA: hypothetical protein DHV28_13745 [Ignavibacteriales bacterium]|nr:hypothetical protein [Ignavibacteriales bacterium]
MKAKVLILSFLTLIIFANETFSQGEAAVPFLLLQPSPSLAAMGQTGTALPTEDPFGFLWNPAQLGYTSQNNNLSFIFYPSKLEWLPKFNLDLEVKSLAFNFGYNFKDIIDFPISVGFGYSYFELNFGEFLRVDEDAPSALGSFYSLDYYNAYSLGIGIDYYVQLNAGITYKDITSILSDRPAGEEEAYGSWKGTAFDFGLLINVPVLKLIHEQMQIEFENDMLLKPDFNFSVGYSKSNLGDEVYYIDKNQADPLPRMDRIGYGISTGADVLDADFKLNVLNVALTVEAEDILIDRDTIDWDYQSTLSDLKPWKNLINIEGTDKIVSHIGLKLDLFETLSLSTGHFSGRGFTDKVPETSGFELRAKGLFKLWALWAKESFTDFLRDHIDIRYYNTNYFSGDWRETKMTGLALYVHNLNSLF